MNHKIELSGLMGVLNPLSIFDAGARVGMASSHFGQAVPIKNHSLPSGFTAYEKQLPTYDIRVPCNCVVIAIHKRTSSIYKKDPNSFVTIIYMSEEGEYSYIDVYKYNSMHLIYGSEYVLTKEFLNLTEGSFIAKGTVLAHPPSVKDGMYSVGRDVNVINLSVQAAQDDAFMVSDRFCEECGLTELVTVSAQWGRGKLPLPIYGDISKGVYKCYPEVGDFVRPDGVVIALREYDSKNIANMRKDSLYKIDYLTDKLSCVTDPGFQVYRIDATMEKLKHSDKIEYYNSPMYQQTVSHIESQNTYYRNIVATYRSIMKNSNALLSPKLINLVYTAMCNEPNEYNEGGTGIIRKEIKRVPIDDIHMTIYLKRVVPLKKGDKFTNRHGHKGVISVIKPLSEMPVDIKGNIADVVKLGEAIASRTNTGQIIEQYFGASARDLAADLRVQHANGVPHLVLMEILLEFYSIISPTTYNAILNNYNDADKIAHVEQVLRDRIYYHLPPGPNHINMALVRRLKEKFPAVCGPVQYVSYNGKVSTTVRDAVIGVEQIMVLEQSNQQPMATSSAKLQHLGLITNTAKHSKKTANAKDHSTTVFSETETRLRSAAMGGDVVAEIMDHYNSPDAHAAIVVNLLKSTTPTNIPRLLNVPYGNSRAVGIVSNLLECIGIRMLKKDM